MIGACPGDELPVTVTSSYRQHHRREHLAATEPITVII
jgi:hypothetical protein